VIYLDSSALAKLVTPEAETSALQEWLADLAIKPSSSSLIRVELRRAVRHGGEMAIQRAEALLNEMQQLPMTTELLDAAGRISQPLRSLDAIHLASALRIRDSLHAFVAYDKRLLQAAELAGLSITSPGASA